MDFSDKEKRNVYLRQRGIVPIRIPIPLIIDHANAYFIDGPTPILIDTGFFGDQSFAALAGALSDHGRDVADIRTVLLTHGHRDHSGMVREINRVSGAGILLHESDAHILAPGSFSEYLERVFAYYRDMGVAPERIEETRALSAGHRDHYWKEAGNDDRTIIGGFIRAGDRFESGAGPLVVLETPGHTRGSVSFLLEEDGILFSGDLISTAYDPLALVIVERQADGWLNLYDDYRTSLDSLSDLDPALLFPGHGGPIAQGRRLARRALDAQEHAEARVREAVGSNGRQTIASLTETVYPKAFGPILTNALNVVRGIIFRLARQRKVRIDDGWIVWPQT
ncbi:MAG: MBL fold metallo-hydrolase [Deltaproteobacteria bacterium]|nr:MBL fold metallo-hydrolase [Candidatus Zymogenaceae bacterium]